MTSSRLFVLSLVAAFAGAAGAGCSTEVDPETKEEVDLAEAQISIRTARVLGRISPGEKQSGFYAPPQRSAWNFDARGGDVISLSVRSHVGDAVAFLTDERWNVLAWNDDAEPGTRDAYVRYTVPAGMNASTFRVVFSDYQLLPASFSTVVEVEPASSCTYQGQTYAKGEKFPASDGCNTCTCGDDGISCTKSVCACSRTDPTYHYVAAPAQCQGISWTCAPGQVRFSNECGCGCKDL